LAPGFSLFGKTLFGTPVGQALLVFKIKIF
jgi:hypothetical protein